MTGVNGSGDRQGAADRRTAATRADGGTGAAAPVGGREQAPAPRRQNWRGLGESLGRRRQDLGMTIDQVEEATKVRAAYLGAIEAGRRDDLPGEAYARGFVRLYARLVGLDGRDLLRRHGIGGPILPSRSGSRRQPALGAERDAQGDPEAAPQPDRSPAPPGATWLPWAVLAAAVVLAGLVVLVVHG